MGALFFFDRQVSDTRNTFELCSFVSFFDPGFGSDFKCSVLTWTCGAPAENGKNLAKDLDVNSWRIQHFPIKIPNACFLGFSTARLFYVTAEAEFANLQKFKVLMSFVQKVVIYSCTLIALRTLCTSTKDSSNGLDQANPVLRRYLK